MGRPPNRQRYRCAVEPGRAGFIELMANDLGTGFKGCR